MNVKHLTIGGAAAVLTASSLLVVQSSADSTAAFMPVEDASVAAEVEAQLAGSEREAARAEAEASRQQIPAIVAEREEAAREAEAARKAEEAARAEEARKAEEAHKAAAQRAKEQAAGTQAQAPAQPAPATPTPPRTNVSGIAASAYTGPMYNAGYESTRKCIVRKESGGNYGIVSSNGLYHGAYQFSRPTGDATAQRMGRPDLVGVPVSSWSRYDQDMAFWTLWNHGAGRGNWPTAAGC